MGRKRFFICALLALAVTVIAPATVFAADEGASGPAEEPAPPTVTAQVAPDEKSVALVASSPELDRATRVTFRVWSGADGARGAITHEAVRGEDGAWRATAFIAANGFDDPGVPYNCRVSQAVHRLYNPNTGQHLFTTSTNEADTLSRSGWRYEGIAWVRPQEATAAEPAEPDPMEPTEPSGSTEPVDPAVPAPADGSGPEAAGADRQPADRNGQDALGRPASSDEPATGDGAEQLAGASDEAAPRDMVYRLYNPGSGDHLYTTDANEHAVLATAGWEQEGEAFESDPAKGMPVYRLYNPNLLVGSHHFTTDANEYRTLCSGDWKDEGIAWYGATLNADATWSATAGNRFHDDAGAYSVEAHATVPVEPEPAPEGDPEPEPENDPAPESSEGNPAEPVPGPSAALAETAASAASMPAAGDAEQRLEDVVIGTAAFSISRPSASARVANVNNAQGTFDVIVSDLTSPSGVAHVFVPTWSTQNGQRDIVWYEAARQPDGSYKISANVNRHIFSQAFTSHVYVKAGNGLMVNTNQLNAELSLANYLKMGGGPYTYSISIFNPGNVSRVQMPTWSDAGGQDDIVWFDARNQGNGWWTASIDVTRLQHSGTVHTHVYADGGLRNAVDFTIQPWEILEWKYRNMNERARGLSSPTQYLLCVDTSNCFVGVYQGSQGNWDNTYWWLCAPGTWATPTVKGVFSVGNKGYSFGHGYTCYWFTQFYEDYLFHSIKYYEGTFSAMDPTLGAPASLGCVRLDINNAKWIYDNVPRGTTVLVY